MDFNYDRCDGPDYDFVCEKCNATYYTCKKTVRLIKSDTAKRFLMIHRKSCNKSQIPDVKESTDCKEGRAFVNCPVCNIMIRIDRVVGHCLSHHRVEMSASMTPAQKSRGRTLSLPILTATNSSKKECLWVCLCCKKGSMIFTKHPDRDFYVSDRDLIERHKKCLPLFHKYAHYFTESTEDVIPVPFAMKRYGGADVERIRKEMADPVASDTVHGAPPPPPIPPPDTLHLVESNLGLRDTVKKLESEMEAMKTQPIVRLTPEYRASLLQFITPDPDDTDQEMLNELLKSVIRQSARSKLAETRRTALEDKISDMEDILRVLVGNVTIKNAIIRSSLLTEDNMALLKSITGLLDD